jgi:hypothetical protein
MGFKSIMGSIINFNNANRDDLIQHEFHFIGGPGGTGKSALFKKLHAACCKNGILITICAQSSLAALSFDGATTAHSLFSYPVEDENDIDDQNLPEASTVILTHYVSTGRWLYEKTHTYCKEEMGGKSKSFFTGKSNCHNRLIISSKMRTVIKIKGGDVPDGKIPDASRGEGLVGRL